MTVSQWEREYDTRILPVIIHHYISRGEEVWEKITEAEITNACNGLKKDFEQAEREGKIAIMTPEFIYSVNMACYKLYREDIKIKSALIRKYYI